MHYYRIRILLKILRYSMQCLRHQLVIAVQPVNDVAGSPAETLIDGIALPTVFFTHPVSKPVRILLNNLNRIICTAPVNDYILYVWIALIQHGENSILNILTLVVGGSDDGYFRIIVQGVFY